MKGKHVFATRWGVIGVGALIGILAALLQKFGNPANMGIAWPALSGISPGPSACIGPRWRSTSARKSLALSLVRWSPRNFLLGQFHPGFAGLPVAHNQHGWNFAGMALAGLAFCLADGCSSPSRHGPAAPADRRRGVYVRR